MDESGCTPANKLEMMVAVKSKQWWVKEATSPQEQPIQGVPAPHASITSSEDEAGGSDPGPSPVRQAPDSGSLGEHEEDGESDAEEELVSEALLQTAVGRHAEPALDLAQKVFEAVHQDSSAGKPLHNVLKQAASSGLSGAHSIRFKNFGTLLQSAAISASRNGGESCRSLPGIAQTATNVHVLEDIGLMCCRGGVHCPPLDHSTATMKTAMRAEHAAASEWVAAAGEANGENGTVSRALLVAAAVELSTITIPSDAVLVV